LNGHDSNGTFKVKDGTSCKYHAFKRC